LTPLTKILQRTFLTATDEVASPWRLVQLRLVTAVDGGAVIGRRWLSE